MAFPWIWSPAFSTVILAAVTIAAPASPADSWESQTELGKQLQEQGRYDEAEKAYLAALSEAKKDGGKDAQLAASLNNLASVYDIKARYSEAEQLYRRALDIREKT